MFHNSHIKKIIISGLLLGLIFQSSISFAVATNPLPNPYPEELLKHNTNVLYENERFSLFLVLSRLSLEELQEMLKECLAMAFRTEGEFKMSTTTLSATIDQSFKDGLSNFLAEYLSPGSDDYAEAFYKKLKDEINEKYETCTSTEAERPDCIQKCVNQEGISETECARKCRKTSKAISDLLADFLTGDLRSKLPSEIQKILNERLRDVIFSDKVNAILSTSTLAVLNKALGEALNKTIVDEVPALKETLGRKVTSYMAPSLVKPLEKIDRLLSFKIEDLKTYIDNKIASTTATMAAKLKEAVTKTKNTANAGTNLDRTGCCNIAYFRGEHWYWSFTERKCKYADRAYINDHWSTILLGIRDCGTKDTNIIPGETMSPPQNQIDFCEMSSDSCWQNSVCAQCDKAETWKEVFNIGQWWSSFTKNLFTALLAMPQQIMLAMIDVAAHTLTEYAQVWVEDELIAPLQPYFNKFAEFQKKLHKALNYTVADLLPKQAKVLLTSNADQILDMICKGAQKGGIDIGSEEEEIKKNREAACNTYKELHQDLLSQLADTGHLGKEIKDALNSTVFKLLPSNLQQLLASSTAELLWPEITNIKKLILGTPKQIICGELFNKNFEVKIDDTNSSVFEKCTTAGPIGLRTTQGTIGLLPYIDKTSTFWTGLNSGLKEKYAISCPIIWYVCQNPLSPWGAKVGDVLVNIISSQCASIDKKTSNKCGWNNYSAPANANLPDEFKPGCAACKTLNSSLAFSLFKYGMEQKYGTSTAAVSPTNPRLNERAAYQWLYVAFPLLRDSANISNFNGGTKQVAVVARGFKEAEWDDNVPNSTSSIVQEIKYYSGTSELPPSATALAQTFITWMTNEASGKEILTSIPLGVIKPFNPGEATLLRDAGKGSKNEEFLAYTPYEFLEQELCRKVIADFKKDYSTSTIEAIMATEANKLAQISGIPYSVESLRHTTMAQAEQILLSNDEIDAERKASYLTCFALDKKPAALFGLDQKLIEYVRPEPYKVLFTLIKEKLKEDERPTLLNKLLIYLYRWNPVDLACAILTKKSYDADERAVIDNASSTPAEIAAAQKRIESKKTMTDFACNFLGTTMGDRIKKYLPKKEMICLIA
ncbi:hypothetical protein KKA09_03170, partial [Patescibacteria group bacterium]|nr:hypothetical protein [Patescibacteria group bacterium]